MIFVMYSAYNMIVDITQIDETYIIDITYDEE